MSVKLNPAHTQTTTYVSRSAPDSASRRLIHIQDCLAPNNTSAKPLTATGNKPFPHALVHPLSGKIIARSLEIPSTLQSKLSHVIGCNIKDPADAEIFFLADHPTEQLSSTFLEVIRSYGKKEDIVVIEGYGKLESLSEAIEADLKQVLSLYAENLQIPVDVLKEQLKKKEIVIASNDSDPVKTYLTLQEEGYTLYGCDDMKAYSADIDLAKRQVQAIEKTLQFINRHIQMTAPNQKITLQDLYDMNKNLESPLQIMWNFLTDVRKHKNCASYTYFLGFICTQLINALASEWIPERIHTAKQVGWPTKGWKLFNALSSLEKERKELSTKRDLALVETVTTLHKKHPEKRVFAIIDSSRLLKKEIQESDLLYVTPIFEKFSESKCALACPIISPNKPNFEKLSKL